MIHYTSDFILKPMQSWSFFLEFENYCTVLENSPNPLGLSCRHADFKDSVWKAMDHTNFFKTNKWWLYVEIAPTIILSQPCTGI